MAASTQDGESKSARLGMARAHLALESIEACKQQLAWLKQRHPRDAEVAYWVGRVAEREGQAEAAQKQYELALKNEPAASVQVDATVALARLHRRAERAEQGEALLQQAQQRLPNSLHLQRALGELAGLQRIEVPSPRRPRGASRSYIRSQRQVRRKRITSRARIHV